MIEGGEQNEKFAQHVADSKINEGINKVSTASSFFHHFASTRILSFDIFRAY